MIRYALLNTATLRTPEKNIFPQLLDSNSCHAGSIYHSNVKVLDLSHNNISKIYPGFFKPAEISLTNLYLGYNSLMVSVFE